MESKCWGCKAILSSPNLIIMEMRLLIQCKNCDVIMRVSINKDGCLSVLPVLNLQEAIDSESKNSK